MSECVVRMEFRKNCLDCDLHQIVYGDSYADIDVYCFKEKRFVGKRFGPIKDLARPSWCPIIFSLPKGHGRLVDEDELFYNMFVAEDGRVVPNMDCDGRHHLSMHVEDVKRHICEATTIVPGRKERNMSDLIDRQTLKDYVSSLSTSPLNEWNTWGVIAAIDKQPTVNPWRRVESKEDLPKENNTYIVYLRQGTKVETPEWMGGEPLSYVVEMEFDREQMLWRADDDAYNAILSFVDTERDFHVTHWMEKPKPPQEDA